MATLAVILVIGFCFMIVSAKPRLVQSEQVLTVFRASRIFVDEKDAGDGNGEPDLRLDDSTQTADENSVYTQLTDQLGNVEITDQLGNVEITDQLGNEQTRDQLYHEFVHDLMRQLMKGSTNDSKGITMNDGQCSCKDYTCSCCYQLDIPKIYFKGKVCLTLTYLQGQWAVQVTLTFNGKVIIDQRIDGKTPAPICAKFKQASVCLRFYQFDFRNNDFTGCAALQATIFHIVIHDIELGCFKIPPSQTPEA